MVLSKKEKNKRNCARVKKVYEKRERIWKTLTPEEQWSNMWAFAKKLLKK